MTDHSFYRRNNRKPTRSQRSSTSAKGIFSKIWAYGAATSSIGLPHWRRTYWAARTRMTNLPLQPYQTRLAYRPENSKAFKYGSATKSDCLVDHICICNCISGGVGFGIFFGKFGFNLFHDVQCVRCAIDPSLCKLRVSRILKRFHSCRYRFSQDHCAIYFLQHFTLQRDHTNTESLAKDYDRQVRNAAMQQTHGRADAYVQMSKIIRV